MLNIALGNTDVSACLPGDADHNMTITVDEILTAVNNALNGCAPTPTPSATAGSATPSPAGAPNQLTRQASGAGLSIAQGLRAIPALVSALTQIAGGGSAGALEGSAASLHSCNAGGTYDFSCTQAVTGAPPRNYTLSLSSCTLHTSGGTVALDGNITTQSTESGPLSTCSFPPLALSTFNVAGVHITAVDGAVTTLDATVNLSGSVSVTPDIASSCKIAAVDMTLSGTLALAAPSETLTFNGTSVHIDIDQFNSDCVPVRYRITLNGAASLSGSAIGATFDGAFTNFVFSDDTTSGSNDLVNLNGQVDAGCLAAAATFSTVTALSIPPAAPCPAAGTFTVSSGSETDLVSYSGVGVAIDLGNDGSVDLTFPSCVDTGLLACPL